MYERLLIPVDGSDGARRAAERGFELAGQLGSDVHVIGVVETGVLGSIRLPGDAASAKDAFTQEMRGIVDRTCEAAEERGLSATAEIRTGVPVTEILEYVDEIDADLVVMGSRGRGGLGRVMLGSVTEGVTRYGDIDVLVVESPAERAEG